MKACWRNVPLDKGSRTPKRKHSLEGTVPHTRYGSVFLPITERKHNFIKELEHYGTEARDSDINDGKAKLENYSFGLADSIHQELKNLKNQMEYDKEERRRVLHQPLF